MRLRIRHETVYEYTDQAHDSHNEVRLQPRDDEQQRCFSFRLVTNPPSRVRTHQDYFGNTVHYFDLPGLHRRLVIQAEALVITFKPKIEGPPRGQPLALDGLIHPDLRNPLFEYLAPSACVPLGEEFKLIAAELLATASGDGARFWDALLAYLKDNFTYQPGSTSVEDDALQVLNKRRGVCQDFAHLTIALARSAGVPSRYVSGYVQPMEGLAEASHAWAELFLPGPGWVGLDASGPGPIDERYARVAYGRDYTDAMPVRGTFRGGGKQELLVDVSVQQMSQQQ